jgi:hypothetical protein
MNKPTDELKFPLTPQSKAELMGYVHQAWELLGQTVNSLSADQMTRIKSADGWAVKDHLVHLTVWEQSLLALLQGRPRHEAMGMDEATFKANNVDGHNAFIYERNKDRPLRDVLAAFRQSHQQLLAELDKLTDADLLKPYSHYQPNDPPYNERPVLRWIVGDTYEHYVEHLTWIKALIEQDKHK